MGAVEKLVDFVKEQQCAVEKILPSLLTVVMVGFRAEPDWNRSDQCFQDARKCCDDVKKFFVDGHDTNLPVRLEYAKLTLSHSFIDEQVLYALCAEVIEVDLEVRPHKLEHLDAVVRQIVNLLFELALLHQVKCMNQKRTNRYYLADTKLEDFVEFFSNLVFVLYL